MYSRSRWKKIVYAAIVVCGLPFAVDTYFLDGELTARVARLVNVDVAQQYAIDQLQYAEPSSTTNLALTELAAEARDPIVLERAVRTLRTNSLVQQNVDGALAHEVRLATDSRVRPSARAGAIENLAAYYIYNQIDSTLLDQYVTGNSILSAAMRNATVPDEPTVALLEYGRDVSVRPYTLALLAREYARLWYETGNSSFEPLFTDALAEYQALRFEFSDMNPLQPQAETAIAESYIFANQVASDEVAYVPEQQIIFALDAAAANSELIAETSQLPMATISSAQSSVFEQVRRILRTLEVVDGVAYADTMRDYTKRFIETHNLPLAAVPETIQTFIDTTQRPSITPDADLSAASDEENVPNQ